MRSTTTSGTAIGAFATADVQHRVPQAGEIWWMSLDPTKGHEQAGFRPILVLSPAGINGPTKRFIGVPLTTSLAPAGTARARMQVRISGMPRECAALPDQITTLDWIARSARYDGQCATEQELKEIRLRVAAICGIG
ncbi:MULTISPECIES: type II toxin-antitoxin system PemK/MazF family toxin [Cupriavidus]|uniref:type II toxin-antitoxin system PemK/MazF family toxin n=1 Tax=Cupriavidus TaxID=106589 RepID=UPI000290FDDC|nr:MULTISPECIES: type II toxin-antitoxin system PemK/MazF family toxin [Cupriavidus]